MTDQGSGWWFPVREGLLCPEHIERIGAAMPLFLYCLKYATVARQHGALIYQHVESARELGVPQRTVKRWFDILQQHGYITITRRKPYHLEVMVSKFAPVEEMPAGTVDMTKRSATNGTSPREVPREVPSDGPSMTPLSITNKLISYLGKTSADARGPTLAGAFQMILDDIKTTKNNAPLLRELYVLCFGGDPPEYGFLGIVAKKVGGAGRLAELMWQTSTKPPTGDPLAYILKAYGPKHGGNGHASREQANDTWANMDVAAIIESNRIRGKDA